MQHGTLGGVLFSKPERAVETIINVPVFIDWLGHLEDMKLISALFLNLLQFNFAVDSEELDLQSKSLRITLVLAIMDKYGIEVLQNPGQVLCFIKNVLASNETELVSLGLALLGAVFGNGKLDFIIMFFR
jgi:hypothetical protein